MGEPGGDTPDSTALPRTSLGSYRIERELGRGGMGTVFLAYDTTLHRHVALKVVEATGDGDAARARLLREARSAAALNHPNICTIHEVGDAGGQAFIAMEYVEGRSLGERIAEGALDLDEALDYGLQVAEALAFAHDRGVVHRDLKAANVIVTGGGRLKIVDFGLARRSDPRTASETTMASLAPAGVAVGTPYAMAPEQVRGEGTDARGDVWALGVLLFELVSAARPFAGGTLPDLFSSILRDPPASLPPGVPSNLKAVIARCLEKSPERRFQRAEDVRQALAACRAGEPEARAMWRPRARRRVALSAGILLLVAAAVVTFDLGGVRRRFGIGVPNKGTIRLAVLPFKNLTGDAAQEFFCDGLTEELTTELGRLHPGRLSVIARTSSMRYKDRDVPLDQIGRELQVSYVLEGSARREGTRVRINATLIQVGDQTQRWAESFERDLSGILILQSDLARGVARSLALALLPAEDARLRGARPVNPEAHEAYLKGLSHQQKLTRPDLDAAEQYFEIALAKEPDYALAHAGLAGVWSGRQQMGFAAPRDAGARLKAATAKALALDATLPEAHYRLALQHAWTDWDWAAAETEFQRTIELAPSFAQARAAYSHHLLITQRQAEAMEQVRRAVELDPLGEMVKAFYGVVLINSGQPAEAVVKFREILETTPGSPMALNGLLDAFVLLGRDEDALAAEKARWAARRDEEIVRALTQGFAEGGYRGARRRAADTFAARSRSTYVAPVPVALMYMRAGEIDRCFEWLEKALADHNPNLPYVAVGRVWEPLRGDPRHASLLRRMNLSE